MHGSNGVRELQSVGIAEYVDIVEIRPAVCGGCCVWELLSVGVAVSGNCGV